MLAGSDFTNDSIGEAPVSSGALNSECASRVVDDIVDRKMPHLRKIVFANEKGGVGKSTLAFHTAIGLANRGHQVLVIDLDARQRSLARSIESRHGSAVCLGVDLPTPKCRVLDRPSGAMLVQEISRLGGQCNVVIIDAPGHDAPGVRRAIALADTLVTPLNPSFFDLDVLANFNPVTQEILRPGQFAQTVLELRAEQELQGLKRTEWMLAMNRVRHAETAHLARTLPLLERIAASFDLKIVEGLSERVAYRSLLQFGLTLADLAAIPQMRGIRGNKSPEMDTFIRALEIAHQPGSQPATLRSYSAKVPHRTREDFARSLHAQLSPSLRADPAAA